MIGSDDKGALFFGPSLFGLKRFRKTLWPKLRVHCIS